MSPAGRSRVVRVAAVQAAPALLDLPVSLDRLEQWARRAAREGARLIAFGETWLTGYPAWLDESPEAALWGHPGAKAVFQRLVENSVVVPGPAVDRLAALARELGATLVVGMHERAGRTLYNTQLTFGPDGALARHHRKLMPTYHERLIWAQGPGDTLAAPCVDGLKVGSLICWEHWMPLTRQAMHDAGEEVHVAGWPGVHEMHLIASRSYAFEGRCFVLAVGSILRVKDMPPELPPKPEKATDPNGFLIRGGTVIIAPNGRLLAGPVFEEETVVVADCDLDEITREALTLDVSGHYSRRDVFEFRVKKAGEEGRGKRDE
ncbi:MAG TPA: carbon-nitrogen hydrolase family protein [Gemmatimonadales bacterium]|nr:carbon-nitrogen hydrolase family protein [Gemmatimonadales bacterium]